MDRALKAFLACGLLIGALPAAADGYGQTAPADSKPAEKAKGESEAKPFYMSLVDVFQSPNVPLLSEQRKGLEQAVQRLQTQIDLDARTLTTLRGRAASKKQFGEFQQSEIDLQLKTNKDPARQKILEARRAELALQIESANAELKRAEQLDAAIEDNRSRIFEAKARIFEIEARIDEAINIQLRILGYRIWLSAMFAALIGVLMWRFFAVTLSDPTVRQAVFSAQSGIQFLTLFCLVIAIFVFGIAGILEGKELSALLGGLSGYILGRVTQSGAAAPAAVPKSLAELAAQAKG